MVTQDVRPQLPNAGVLAHRPMTVAPPQVRQLRGKRPTPAQLRRGAEGSVGLRAEHPHALADAPRIDPSPTKSITRRRHYAGSPEKRHLGAEPFAPLLGLTGITREYAT
jgi:hypothetical protein